MYPIELEASSIDAWNLLFSVVLINPVDTGKQLDFSIYRRFSMFGNNTTGAVPVSNGVPKPSSSSSLTVAAALPGKREGK
jgi:hypothetical protein